MGGGGSNAVNNMVKADIHNIGTFELTMAVLTCILHVAKLQMLTQPALQIILCVAEFWIANTDAQVRTSGYLALPKTANGTRAERKHCIQIPGRRRSRPRLWTTGARFRLAAS